VNQSDTGVLCAWGCP